jgi:hypothetical protein
MKGDRLPDLSCFWTGFRLWQRLFLGSAFVAVSATGLLAQGTSTMKRLPPPPPLPVPNAPIPTNDLLPPQKVPVRSTPLPVSSPPSQGAVREYTFQAPSSPSLPARTMPKAATPSRATSPAPAITPNQLYRVEVEGTDEALLAQVKAIEPLAAVWQTQGIIYGGIFTQSQQAQERVRQLENKGLVAKITPISREISRQRRLDR